MRVDCFDYDLPPSLIAQHPTAERDDARLMVVPANSEITHAHVRDLANLIPENSLLVLNDTRVLPARLLAQKETGGRVEIFLLRRTEQRREPIPHGPANAMRDVEIWKALGKASKALRFGIELRVGGIEKNRNSQKPVLFARILARAPEDGLLEVALYTDGRTTIDEAVAAWGRMPLPPYIKRESEVVDEERYQTVYARAVGAVAAPTAGLHLSRALLGRLAVRGCEVATVTLHVGLGTFQPVTTEDLDEHKMHSEWYEVTPTAARAVMNARRDGRKVIAIGTTAVRALESAASNEKHEVLAQSGETRLLIQPGYRFRAVDMLLTNFHLPKSTLLALVSAFCGREKILDAYRLAIAEQYRFFSYGDAMLLSRVDP